MLGISNITAEHGKALCASIKSMDHLKILALSSISEDGILNLQSISSPPQFLEHIILRGRLEELPNWIPKLQNLVTLGLYFSGLEEDPLKHLLPLPNLTNLFLNQGYDGEELHFEEGGFRKLKKLTLKKLDRLKMMKIDKGALPLLEQLEIGQCPKLKEVPSGIQHLENLKTLDFSEVPRNFLLGMQPDGGKDYWIVKKVPTIRFRYRLKENDIKYTSSVTQICRSVCKGESWRTNGHAVSMKDKV
ncbi:disease resistance protein RPM1-like [Corylus avellana]|uniref:disease resistance protein RPM1-like n=1 Tax=Corylus avellana TaxID=13451 RepID=UPI00286B82C7|nr:disease resistance protein RPM1-like [Corylus avellana]